MATYAVPQQLRSTQTQRVSQTVGGLAVPEPPPSPASLDRAGTRALGDVTVTSVGGGIPTVYGRGIATGTAKGVSYELRRVAPSSRVFQVTIAPVTISPASLSHTRGQGAVTVHATSVPSGLSHTRAQGTPTVHPTVVPAGLVHTRALGSPTVAVGFFVSPASLTHTRALGSPVLQPEPASLTHTRAQGDITVTVGFLVSPASLSHTRGQGSPVLQPEPLSLTHTRALGDPTVSTAATPTADVYGRGLTRGVTRAVQPHPAPNTVAVTQVFQGLTPFKVAAPTGLVHTRGQGSPTVSIDTEQANPLSLTHVRSGIIVGPPFMLDEQPGAVTVSVAGVLSPAGLVNARALGSPVLQPEPLGLVHARALGSPSAQRATVRQLGHNLVVTVQWIPRPNGLVHTSRALGTPTARGHLTALPGSLTHTRGQGTPLLPGRAFPLGLVHTRGQGTPFREFLVSAASISHTRGQGAVTLTTAKIPRPETIVHLRNLGSPTARGHQTLGPPSLDNVRLQGTPTLSGRSLPAGIVHTRSMGTPAVNVRTLVPVTLDRAS